MTKFQSPKLFGSAIFDWLDRKALFWSLNIGI
jgi:hypothetical protein